MTENKVRRGAWNIVEDLRRCAKEIEAPPDIAALMREAADEIDSYARRTNFIHEFLLRMAEHTGYKLIRAEPKRKR